MFIFSRGKNGINKLLSLERPLVFFDLETTGLSLSKDRIVEIAYIRIEPDGLEKTGDFFFNPGIEVSEESFAIHGIGNDFLKDKPLFREKAQELWDVFNNTCYGGFNVLNFDLPMLKREFIRVGMDFDYAREDVVDAKNIYHYMEPRTLSAAYRYYCKKELKNAHNAMTDVQAVVEVVERQLKKYKELNDWQFISKINNFSSGGFYGSDKKFYWKGGEAHFAFSKYRDEPLAKIAEIDSDFLNWMLEADFSEETKAIVREALGPKNEKK